MANYKLTQADLDANPLLVNLGYKVDHELEAKEGAVSFDAIDNIDDGNGGPINPPPTTPPITP